ncbi:hypothetical protein KL86DPRO_20362 [uncultured delta proteobacterium]|uniref:Uncharacterized protein n=1 Tax=uncultured delta proteobacterium TaxID=34034 RepID=A0A212JZ61_9DELT|nr:hypothetical protein KL86DPRO_20362 [uncultured delta proteobacterium]
MRPVNARQRAYYAGDALSPGTQPLLDPPPFDALCHICPPCSAGVASPPPASPGALFFPHRSFLPQPSFTCFLCPHSQQTGLFFTDGLASLTLPDKTKATSSWLSVIHAEDPRTRIRRMHLSTIPSPNRKLPPDIQGTSFSMDVSRETFLPQTIDDLPRALVKIAPQHLPKIRTKKMKTHFFLLIF